MDGYRHDADTYRRIEVITGDRRRRDWSAEEKARIVAESADPDVSVSEVARRNGVHRGLLSVWRRQAREALRGAPMFAQMQVEGVSGGSIVGRQEGNASSSDRIEIEIGDARVRVPQGADAATLRSIVAALRSTR
ncbi:MULTISPECIES: transposase [unclassified Mesorhizobium]|uniref:IS66-like element accessory protein TnpA n=2 Tax=Mesorhizobium TaxID=68287 RepID=UPI000F7558C7|nr:MULTISPECIES: transposase [unclassified Mesorhizobium]AZO07917.1 transposase [Mesorhizobium sp. M3A.F.Ca.ET.080.04.2.1]AZO09547.1 transposase [Mesorhizobium sp. M3A.F.Ca.ET.080.04.2.1]RWB68895.1 MAG: transposase [Mesorhizobium sp.]RWD60532.1 MAG: transposase [Mesorhizobium sp.]RWF14228.1 MAG: transposase [Mesorhizobium sp.]